MTEVTLDRKTDSFTVDVVIPSYKPDEGFITLIKRLKAQSVKPDGIIIINTEKSGWDDLLIRDKDEVLKDLQVEHISKREFDHARTRNRAVKRSKADFVLIMTMDALPADKYLIEKLLKPFRDEEVAVSYARQLPRRGAKAVERLSREFNYPDVPAVKSLADIDRLGIKTFFCSNVCAMYRRNVFERVGGFFEPAIFNEDMVYAHTVMQKGCKVAYCADARVYHSHDYPGLVQMKRNFDNGVSQAMHPEVFEGVSSEKEGVKMLFQNSGSLIKSGHALSVIPLFWQSACKYLGFFLGKRYRHLPGSLVKAISLNRGFWR